MKRLSVIGKIITISIILVAIWAFVPLAFQNWKVGAAGVAISTQNPLQIAMLRWYEANSFTSFFVGNSPAGVVFDGVNIWSSTNNQLVAFATNSGRIVNTYPCSCGGLMAYDGANIWAIAQNDGAVTKVRIRDGKVVGTYSVEGNVTGIAFDGANIWVTLYSGDNSAFTNVHKLRASDGVELGRFWSGGGVAYGVAFDGQWIWVSNRGGNIAKLRPSDGAKIGDFTISEKGATKIAVDGTNVWVTIPFENVVAKVRASDGAVLGKFPVGTNPTTLAYDGANVWVTNLQSNSVTKVRASDGVILGTIGVGKSPDGIAFDGASIWVLNHGNTISKL